MSIQYNYEIIAVDESARCMEVVYTSEGRQTQHIGARLPYEGETLESIIQMYAPTQYWLEQEMLVVPPQVGASGTITPTVEQVEAQPQDGQATPSSGEIPQAVL